MMTSKDFRKHAHELVDFMADYIENVEQYPVKSQVKPNDIYNVLPDNPPTEGVDMSNIIADFKDIIMPGITHWQSPYFHAYFPANSSYPSILAEMLTATLGAQCMIWETSPAAAELEEKVLEWLKDAMNLPSNWVGVIQDTASTATLCAIISAREKYTDFSINKNGFQGENLRVYCSSETHSSIEKGVKIAGIGKTNLVKIPVDHENAISAPLLEQSIKADIAQGKKPICVVAALGTTSTTAVDSIADLAEICKKYDIWFHIDAAYAGSALILPEYQHLIKGIEDADSYVFNPHKWLFTNFDCTAYYVKDRNALVDTFSILPEYLKTQSRGKVNDYRDWGIPLGRRFRALKLWFVIRSFGIKGLQSKIREHIAMAQWFENQIEEHVDYEIMAPVNFNLVCFRWLPNGVTDEQIINEKNQKLISIINNSGKAYLTHTKVKGKYTIRVVIGQTNVTQDHINNTWQLIQNTVAEIEVV